MLMRYTALPVIALMFAGMNPAAADPGKLGGLAYLDYYYVASADDADPVPEKRNAFRFRRFYLTYNQVMSDRFDVRFRLEANDAGYGTRPKMIPFVKHGYVKWKDALGGDLYIGLSGTPTNSIAESVWGYRPVEKAILDLNGFGSTSDIGLGLVGASGGLNYHLMVANGPGQRPETDNGKKFYGSISVNPTETLVAEVYGDVDFRPDGQDRLTGKVFLGVQSQTLRLGVEPFIRVNGEAAADGDDVTFVGVSLFGSVSMGEDRIFGRFDVVEEDEGDTTDQFVLAGYDWTVEKGVHIIPNIHIQIPDGPDANVQGRVTAYYKF
jgi:hypothetical protein